MTTEYQWALWGVWVVLVTFVVQALVAAMAKGRQPGAIPGKMPPNLSHDSFVFRAHRTFMNSLENSPLFFGTVFLALFMGTSPGWVTGTVWVFALARIAHMVLYYVIATERNPSPRSYFFLLGLVANLVLLGALPFV